jgi:hypothetical protein
MAGEILAGIVVVMGRLLVTAAFCPGRTLGYEIAEEDVKYWRTKRKRITFLRYQEYLIYVFRVPNKGQLNLMF